MNAKSSPPVKIAFYGGLGEIGANMASIEVEGKICLMDVGLTFPDAEHYGVDLILPDWSTLLDRAADIQCVVISHGHEDHMGALPFFLRDFPDTRVYGSRLAVGLLKAKLEEHPGAAADFVEVEATDRITDGPFDIEFVGVTHSIPDGFATAFHTPHGTILHSGDFKLDQTPIDGKPTDLPHLAEIGDAGVALLLADSTGADTPGHVKSEKSVGKTLRAVFGEADGRIIVTTFASHVHRVQQIIDAAADNGRKICFVGRSMVRNMPIARDLGYLEYDDKQVVEMREVDHMARDSVVIICTGSQGEPFAALSRMAAGSHKQVSLQVGDTVVMASSVIPGNEHAIFRSINGLFRQGANVVHKGVADVHVSGHASADELKFFHNIVRAKNFVPVHGEYRHMVAHAQIARDTGLTDEHIFVCEDGSVLELRDGTVSRGERFEPGRVYVDGLGVGDVGTAVLRHREALSNDGVCVVVLSIDGHSRLVGDPQLIQQGVIYQPEQQHLLDQAVSLLVRELKGDGSGDQAQLRRNTARVLNRFWKDETGRRPVILPVLVEV
jgi:ribonuclease J